MASSTRRPDCIIELLELNPSLTDDKPENLKPCKILTSPNVFKTLSPLKQWNFSGRTEAQGNEDSRIRPDGDHLRTLSC